MSQLDFFGGIGTVAAEFRNGPLHRQKRAVPAHPERQGEAQPIFVRYWEGDHVWWYVCRKGTKKVFELIEGQ